MMTMEGMMDSGVLDDIIRRLLEGKGGSKQVQLSEGEIRQLCVNARQIFLSQPSLLHLRAPIRICGLFPFLLLLIHTCFLYAPMSSSLCFCFPRIVNDYGFCGIFVFNSMYYGCVIGAYVIC